MNRWYCSFDVDRFFRDYKENEKSLKYLREKLDATLVSSGGRPDEPKVAGGLPTSSVESIVERREKIAEEIAQYERYFDTVERIINALSGEERLIAEEYFLRGKKRRDQIEILADKIFCSPSTCYRKIKEVRNKIKDIVREEGA